MLRRIIALIAVPAGIGLLGCSIMESTGVSEVTRLSVHLDLEQDSVAPGDTIRADALVVNQGDYTATLVTSAECFATIFVFRDDAEQTFRSDPAACWALSSPLTLEPGDTLAQHWSIEAVHEDGTPFETDSYRIYLDVAAELEKGSPIPDIVSTVEVVAEPEAEAETP